MEQHQDTMAMLDLITRPAFCVKDGVMRSIEDIHQEIYRHVKHCLED